MFLRSALLVAVLALVAGASAARAGMPAPLPTQVKGQKVSYLNESPLLRLQTISFFLAGVILCASVVRWIWNVLQRGFPALPRLGFFGALGAVFLWGLLFVLVLTMISGARELMTPGAWKKQGFTYKLDDGPPPPSDPPADAVRRRHLEQLRTALWQYAATHNGRFPAGPDASDLPAHVWEIPDSYGARYRYVAGLSAADSPGLLAYEPELEPGARLVLLTNGEVSTASSAEIKTWLARGHRP